MLFSFRLNFLVASSKMQAIDIFYSPPRPKGRPSLQQQAERIVFEREFTVVCKTLTRFLGSPRWPPHFLRSEYDWHEGPGGRKN